MECDSVLLITSAGSLYEECSEFVTPASLVYGIQFSFVGTKNLLTLQNNYFSIVLLYERALIF